MKSFPCHQGTCLLQRIHSFLMKIFSCCSPHSSSTTRSKVSSCFLTTFASRLWFFPINLFIKFLFKPVPLSWLSNGHESGLGLAQQIMKHVRHCPARQHGKNPINTPINLSQVFLSCPNMPFCLLFLTAPSSCPREISYSDCSYNHLISMIFGLNIMVKRLGITIQTN